MLSDVTHTLVLFIGQPFSYVFKNSVRAQKKKGLGKREQAVRNEK